MTSVLNNRKYLNRLWAALVSDFGCLEDLFLRCPGSTFEDFAKCCRKMEITLVMNTTLGYRKGSEDHYKKTTNLIIQTAKSFWLRPYSTNSAISIATTSKTSSATSSPTSSATSSPTSSVTSSKTSSGTSSGTFSSTSSATSKTHTGGSTNARATAKPHDDKLDAKRRVGGFFLTYLMYMKQPYKGRIKIAMGQDDLDVANAWKDKMNNSEVKEEVDFILEDLALREAFEFHLCAPPFGFQAETREYLNNSKSEVITLAREMKDIQDGVTYNGRPLETQSMCVKYQIIKNDLIKEVAQIGSREGNELKDEPTDGSENVDDLTLTSNSYRLLSKSDGKKFETCMDILAKQSENPVLDMPILNCKEGVHIHRRILMETRRRIEHMRKKNAAQSRQAEKASRSYVTEGGIFGRKKDLIEEKQKEKGDRSIFSENIWTYINGQTIGGDETIGEDETSGDSGEDETSGEDDDN